MIWQWWRVGLQRRAVFAHRQTRNSVKTKNTRLCCHPGVGRAVRDLERVVAVIRSI